MAKDTAREDGKKGRMTMKKTCIICGNPATHIVDIGVALKDWQGRWKSTGEIGLCGEHITQAVTVSYVEEVGRYEQRNNMQNTGLASATTH
jgi:hypothetical protein